MAKSSVLVKRSTRTLQANASGRYSKSRRYSTTTTGPRPWPTTGPTTDQGETSRRERPAAPPVHGQQPAAISGGRPRSGRGRNVALRRSWARSSDRLTAKIGNSALEPLWSPRKRRADATRCYLSPEHLVAWERLSGEGRAPWPFGAAGSASASALQFPEFRTLDRSKVKVSSDTFTLVAIIATPCARLIIGYIQYTQLGV